jgi:hypothetical protein
VVKIVEDKNKDEQGKTSATFMESKKRVIGYQECQETLKKVECLDRLIDDAGSVLHEVALS